MTNRRNLREAFADGILVGDGAIGTYLYERGVTTGGCNELLNATQPQTIMDVHREYVRAGAQVIETNTFSANAVSLSKYGLTERVTELNEAGARLARAAFEAELIQDGYVLGAVGSIRAGKLLDYSLDDLREYFREQMEALIRGGVDGLILETFYDHEELLLATEVARSLTELPIVAQFAVEKEAVTADGYSVAQAVEQLHEAGVDVVGFNCRTGPNGILKAVDDLQANLWQAGGALPLSIYPNAGLPDYVDGHYVYPATPEYFADYARQFADRGAILIGGCCGTTPAHVKAMRSALEGYIPQRRSATSILSTPQAGALSSDHEETHRSNVTIVDLVQRRHTVIVELDPPRDLDIQKFMAGAHRLREVQADALTMADNSLAVTRMSNMALGALVQHQVGIKPLIHIACRDRNLIGSQTHLMGLDALGIDHVLAVTGDPARFGDLPDSSSVYDLTSFEMIRMTKQLNEGIAFSGKPLKQRAKFVVGAAFNPNVKYLEKAIARLEKKVASGADYVMTQPVYDPELIVKLAEATKHLSIPIFIGIMPLASGRNAEYLHNEVPGIQLSDEVRRRMAGLEGERGREEGVKIAQELLDVALPLFHGIYLITPFMFYEMTAQLTQYVWNYSAKLSRN